MPRHRRSHAWRFARAEPERREALSPDLIAGALVGLIAGLSSGLLGTSPGGGLVIFSNLLLGAEQHVAQGVSLLAQVPPTSLSGISRYRSAGSRSPMRWLLWIGAGFLAGGAIGALTASFATAAFLRWTYVAYLAILGALFVARGARPAKDREDDANSEAIPAAALLGIGFVAGVSSGFLGIGGGLAITVGLAAIYRIPQHQAQMVSLVLSLVPTNLPAALVYLREGWTVSWGVLAAVVLGLLAGADAGARIAVRMSAAQLRGSMLIMILGMAAYMACKAISG